MYIINSIKRLINKVEKNLFLISELLKRDLEKKYKGTILGMGWSIIGPLLQLLVMRTVFVQFFGKTVNHYTIYLFSGNIVMSYYKEATKYGMKSLIGNAKIFTKINVPKFLFPLTQNLASFINFLLIIIVYFLFVLVDGIIPTWRCILLIFPVICLFMFCFGISMCLSALQVFFRDTSHLYDIFLVLLTYCSAIFYSIDTYTENIQKLFLLNPVYVYIQYFRLIVINETIPSLSYHALSLFYAVVSVFIGSMIYKTQNYKFLYYL